MSILGTEDMSTVSAVMSAFREREFGATIGTTFDQIVFNPVVTHTAPFAHRPREDTTPGVANKY